MKLINRMLIAVALLATGSLALAAPDHGDHDRRGQSHGHYRGHDGHDRRHDDRHRDHRRHDDRRYGYDRDYHRGHDRRYDRGYHHAGRRYYSRHGHWERGHRYYGPTYVVRDYGYYRLRPPPRGYHWVRANNDYLLVAIATGVILDIALQ